MSTTFSHRSSQEVVCNKLMQTSKGRDRIKVNDLRSITRCNVYKLALFLRILIFVILKMISCMQVTICVEIDFRESSQLVN